MKWATTLAMTSLAIVVGVLVDTAAADPAIIVNCNAMKNNNIQEAVSDAVPGDIIYVNGTCQNQNVTIETDDITISGSQAASQMETCDKTYSATHGSIEGQVTIDGVRAKLEHLNVSGPGEGVIVTNRGDAEIFCSNISFNNLSGITVQRASNAVVTANLIEENGQLDILEDDPTRYWACGLNVEQASNVRSDGNRYQNNSFCAVASHLESTFRNGSFIPRRNNDPNFVPNPAELDVYIQRGCSQGTLSGCAVSTNDFQGLAFEVFNGGSVDLRHADVTGKFEVFFGSHLRVDEVATIVGGIDARALAVFRVKNRNLDSGRVVSFTGMASCDSGAQSVFSDVKCGQTCTGIIPGSCMP